MIKKDFNIQDMFCVPEVRRFSSIGSVLSKNQEQGQYARENQFPCWWWEIWWEKVFDF